MAALPFSIATQHQSVRPPLPQSKWLLIGILLLVSIQVNYSQNLIADPGFEIWDGTSGQNPLTLSGLTHWYTANGTADHHHVDNENGSNLTGLEPCPLGEGNTWCGFPYEGGGVLGVWKGNGPDGSKEWGGTQLLEPLVPGDCYEISFWIQNKKDNPDQLYETNQWGVFFSHTQFPAFNANLSDFSTMTDQWVATEEVIGGSEWQQVTFTYTANEAYEYMYIGYMGNVSTSTYTAYNDDYLLGFYAWIDEVIVEHVDVEVPEDLELCLGDSVQLNFSSNYSLSWTDGITTDTTTSVWVTPETTTTYYVEAVGNMGCTKTDSVTVSILAPDMMDYPQPVCVATEPFQLDPTATNGTWVGPGIVNGQTGLFDPSISGSGAFMIEYLADTGCGENFTMFIEVLETPAVAIASDLREGCSPLTVALTANTETPDATYEWNFGDGTTNNENNTTNHTYNAEGTYDIGVTVTHFPGCTAEYTEEDFIHVYQAPVANFAFMPESPDILNPEVQFEDRSQGNILQWQWDFGDQLTSSSPAPLHRYQNAGTYEVALQVISQGNCVDSIRQIVQVKNAARIYVPNAFSPNLDGVNDRFEIGYIGTLYDYEMKVFDRWGAVIFHSSSPDNTWDGSIVNGRPAANGVYTYFVQYTLESEATGGKAEKEVLSGDVMILR